MTDIEEFDRPQAAEQSSGSQAQPGGQPDIAQMVEKIMKNPEFTGIVNELRGGTSGGAPQVSQNEILSHLPDVVSMLKPFIGDSGTNGGSGTGAPQGTQEPPPASSEPPKDQTVLAPIRPPKKYDKSRAEKLMAALKPYLNPGRCEIIDKCVSVMQIGDVMEALQGIEGLTKLKP